MDRNTASTMLITLGCLLAYLFRERIPVLTGVGFVLMLGGLVAGLLLSSADL